MAIVLPPKPPAQNKPTVTLIYHMVTGTSYRGQPTTGDIVMTELTQKGQPIVIRDDTGRAIRFLNPAHVASIEVIYDTGEPPNF